MNFIPLSGTFPRQGSFLSQDQVDDDPFPYEARRPSISRHSLESSHLCRFDKRHNSAFSHSELSKIILLEHSRFSFQITLLPDQIAYHVCRQLTEKVRHCYFHQIDKASYSPRRHALFHDVQHKLRKSKDVCNMD